MCRVLNKKSFCKILARKNFVFYSDCSNYIEKVFFKFDIFDRELSKLMKNWQKVTPLFVDIERKVYLLFSARRKVSSKIFGKFLIISNKCFIIIVLWSVQIVVRIKSNLVWSVSSTK